MTSAYKQAWDKAVKRPFLLAPSFVEIMRTSYGYESKHDVVDGTGYSAVLCNSLLSKNKLSSFPFNFYPPLLNDKVDEDSSLIDEMVFDKMIHQAKKLKNGYVEYKTFTTLSDVFVKQHQIANVEPSIVSILKLKNSYEDQLKGFGKSLKQNIRTTGRKLPDNGIELIRSKDQNDLKKWYHLLVILYRDKHAMISQPLSLYQNLLAYKGEDWNAELFLAKKGKDVVGGIFILKDKNHWEYSWAATDGRLHKLGLNTLLVDFAIQKAIEEKVQSFGYGSSSPQDEKLIYFKSRWGCTSKPIHYYYWNHIPKPIDLESSFSFARKVYKMIPLTILKVLPEFLVSKLI